MALFKLGSNGITSVRRLSASTGLLEKDIEDLTWEHLAEICGEPLFPVRRQAAAGGGKPDILAIDSDGRVVVIEIKRGFDRSHFSQILEYAGWATETSLDEISGMYHRGLDKFWDEWQEFTNTESRTQINKDPRLIMIAETYDVRTRKAIDFLISKKVSLTVIGLTMYQSDLGERLIDVQGIKDPIIVDELDSQVTEDGYNKRSALGISVKELLDAGFLETGEPLIWVRPQKKEKFSAVVLESGEIELPDGQVFSSVSSAAMSAAGIVSANGWVAWRVPRYGDHVALAEVQQMLGIKLFEDSNKNL